MRLWWLLFFLFFFHDRLFSAATIFSVDTDPKLLSSNKLTTDSIDKVNSLSFKTFLSNPVSVRKVSEKMLLASKKINYRKGIGMSFLNIGVTYWSQSYSVISLLYLDTASRYFESKERLLLSDCYRYMGRNYVELKNFKLALNYLNKAQLAADSDAGRSGQVMGELSFLYINTNQYDKALLYANKALKLARMLKNKGAEAILYDRFTHIYLAQNQFDKAMRYCDTATAIGFKVNNKRFKAAELLTKSNILIKTNKINEAFPYAKQALRLGDSLGLMRIIDKSYKAIINICIARNNTKLLIYYQKAYNQFLDKRYAEDNKDLSLIVQNYFELNNQLQGIDLIKRNAQANNLHVKFQQDLIIVLLVSLLIVGIALYIVVFYYRQKHALVLKLDDQRTEAIAQAELIKAQADTLSELNDFKNKLLSIIGHDLRTPIGNLRHITDMFEDGSFSTDEVNSIMKSLNPAVKGAELTLSNLLVWANNQIDGNINIQPSAVCLLDVVKEIEEIFRFSLDQKNMTMHYSVKPHDLVFADENHLKVIFRNLISNAIKFTPNNGKISISVSPEKNYLITSITDTGIGMTSEEIDKLLNINKYFSKPGTQGEKGTGIGLLLCRELVELNGGKLWLTSQINKGTTFYFSLPSVN